MNCFRRWLKWRRFSNRIRSQLPRYHPNTGQKLNWEIYFVYREVKYNTQTGQAMTSGFPQLRIRQMSPGGILIDHRVYEFNWCKKKIEKTKAIWG
jgi:hypothetical protein